jgi:hypothetical protein
MRDIIEMLKLFGPVTGPILGVVGLLALLALWKGWITIRRPEQEKGGDEEHPGHWCQEDAQTERFLKAFELSAQNGQRVVDIFEHVGETQKQILDVLRANGEKLEHGQQSFERALREIHGRIDDLYRRAI